METFNSNYAMFLNVIRILTIFFRISWICIFYDQIYRVFCNKTHRVWQIFFVAFQIISFFLTKRFKFGNAKKNNNNHSPSSFNWDFLATFLIDHQSSFPCAFGSFAYVSQFSYYIYKKKMFLITVWRCYFLL